LIDVFSAAESGPEPTVLYTFDIADNKNFVAYEPIRRNMAVALENKLDI